MSAEEWLIRVIKEVLPAYEWTPKTKIEIIQTIIDSYDNMRENELI